MFSRIARSIVKPTIADRHRAVGHSTRVDISKPAQPLRFGVGHPGHKDLMQNYVLQDFAKSERPVVEALCDFVADNVDLLVEGKDSTFLNKAHLEMVAKGFIGDDADTD